MSFPAEKPFNPKISKTPILGPSSGNPKSFQDPNSIATIGSKIQAMADQANADRLYDTPTLPSEGFKNTNSCKKEGFCLKSDSHGIVIGFLVMVGMASILLSFLKQ